MSSKRQQRNQQKESPAPVYELEEEHKDHFAIYDEPNKGFHIVHKRGSVAKKYFEGNIPEK